MDICYPLCGGCLIPTCLQVFRNGRVRIYLPVINIISNTNLRWWIFHMKHLVISVDLMLNQENLGGRKLLNCNGPTRTGNVELCFAELWEEFLSALWVHWITNLWCVEWVIFEEYRGGSHHLWHAPASDEPPRKRSFFIRKWLPLPHGPPVSQFSFPGGLLPRPVRVARAF